MARVFGMLADPDCVDRGLLIQYALLAAARGALPADDTTELVDAVLVEPTLAAELMAPLARVAANGTLSSAGHDRLLALAISALGGGGHRLLAAVKPATSAVITAAAASVDGAIQQPDPTALQLLAAIAGNPAFHGHLDADRIGALLTLAQAEDDLVARTALAAALALGGSAAATALADAAPRLIAVHGDKGVDPKKGEKRDPNLRGELLPLAFLAEPPITAGQIPELTALLDGSKPDFRGSFNRPALFSLAWRASARPRGRRY